MKILCVADEEDKSYWDFFRPEKLQDIDLIISCGDLKPEYLSFLVTMGHAPVYYVRGNHDYRYDQAAPEGCESIDNRIVEFRGLRIFGLGGCKHFSRSKEHYREQDMEARIAKLRLKLRKGVDIVVTHAPASGYGDLPDLTHSGFDCFVDLIDRYHPKFFLHGHIHDSYNYKLQKCYEREGTKIINVGKSTVLEIPEEELPKPEQKSSRFSLRGKLS